MNINRPTFEKTVDVLVKAYLNGTLEHGNCCACAVGNIIADSCGYTYRLQQKRCCSWEWLESIPKWYSKYNNSVVPCPQVEATGYTVVELAKIERAFEGLNIARGQDYMFDGLMRVVDVLAHIHKINLTVKEQAKQLFVKV